MPVFGGKECHLVTKVPGHGESFTIGDRIRVTALHTPCHTQDSICYYAVDGDHKAVFSGDTLFVGGITSYPLVGLEIIWLTSDRMWSIL